MGQPAKQYGQVWMLSIGGHRRIFSAERTCDLAAAKYIRANLDFFGPPEVDNPDYVRTYIDQLLQQDDFDHAVDAWNSQWRGIAGDPDRVIDINHFYVDQVFST